MKKGYKYPGILPHYALWFWAQLNPKNLGIVCKYKVDFNLLQVISIDLLNIFLKD